MIEKTPELSKLLDSKNKDLYDFVNAKVPISLCYGLESNYGVFQQNNKAVIHIPEGDYSPNSFAHELLHVYLSTLDINIGGALKSQIRESWYLLSVIPDDLSNHITNILEHRKMLPIFLTLGYNKTSFLSDALEPVLDLDIVNWLEGEFRKRRFFCRKLKSKAVEIFIAKYISAKGACIGLFDYSDLLTKMQRIEPELCKIIDSLISRWDLYDETKEGDLLSESYIDISFDFLNEIEDWIKSHNIAL